LSDKLKLILKCLKNFQSFQNPKTPILNKTSEVWILLLCFGLEQKKLVFRLAFAPSLGESCGFASMIDYSIILKLKT
jgi:hypothetical protein